MSKRELALSINKLSKKFVVSRTIARSDGIRDAFGVKKRIKKLAAEEVRVQGDNFWALKDISFDVYKGETLGIIGRNGAGKSTLLKVLSRIYLPDEGSFSAWGRISSLLEVGTGFHNELTGRENIYFNGSLLGMLKKEIDDKYNEIVEFSELGGFIDSPVKYYSSGMRSRLGFSIAVNLDSEIMIIDEALAVGDEMFKRKAMEKMKETAGSGKTVLFVTHSMNFIEESCDRAILLDEGRLIYTGGAKKAVEKYLGKSSKDALRQRTTWEGVDKTNNDKRIQIKSMSLFANNKKMTAKSISYKDSLGVKLVYSCDSLKSTYSLGYMIGDEQGRKLWRETKPSSTSKAGQVMFKIETSYLKPGKYFVFPDASVSGDVRPLNPNRTKVMVAFNLVGHRNDLGHPAYEGIIKPPSK